MMSAPASGRGGTRQVVVALVLVAVGAASAATETWQLTDLGEVDDLSSTANAISDAGVVVGSAERSYQGTPYRRAFAWVAGTRTTDWSSSYPRLRSEILAVNDAGCGVGWQQSTDLASIYLRVFKAAPTCAWNDTVILASLGGSATYGNGINGAEQVVGVSMLEGGQYRAFAFTLGVVGMTDLGVLAGGWGSAAFALNEEGLTVGQSSSTASVRRATTFDPVADLGALPGAAASTECAALAVNDAAVPHIVGWSYGPGLGHPHAVLWQGGGVTDLGVLPGGDWSEAYALNDGGIVVGTARAADMYLHAVLWQDGQILDLNDVLPAGSGWVLNEARGVNNLGQVVGRGYYLGQDRAFLLTPPLFTSGFEDGSFGGWSVVVP
jgi:probable HAF family extracellular repeat protein